MNNNFLIELIASLNKLKSQKQINADIKQLEQAINSLRLTGTFAKGSTKQELNQYIKQLEAQLNHIKLKANIDNKNLQRDIDNALKSVRFQDIDLLNIEGNKTSLKVRKAIADVKSIVDRSPIMLNVELKKEKLNNDLTSYLNKYSKIKESTVLLKESEKVRDLINVINDRQSTRNATDSFQLFKSEVTATGFASKSTSDKVKNMLSHITKIGSLFGVASLAANNFKKSLTTLKENDSILTEVSKTSEMTKKQLAELGDESFKIASKYGQISSHYLLGVQEMARSGYNELSKELGKLSLLAQSAGDMTADNANNYLLATDAAYKYQGSVEKLNKALDGANYISNKNSASLTEIADGIRVSASFAANAGVSIDELTAAEATMIATTKRSGSEMGRAFRSILLSLQQVSGEFDGEVIDEEQLKKVEDRCHSLGVALEYMKDGVATLRNPMEILRDLAKVYNSLPDNSVEKQGLISDIGGKYHANALSALLGRWDLYEKMLSEYSQGTGSTLEEANKTALSWEGRLNSLQNSWDSFINSLTNKDAILSGISFFDRLIQGAESLTDVIGEIPVLLTAINTSMVAVNKDYGITQLVNPETNKLDIQGNMFGVDFTAIKEQKKHFAEAEEAIAEWNQRIKIGQIDISDFNEAVVQNNAQLKTYLATTSKDAPASLAGYKASLNAAGISTDALRLKTILLNSAISMGIGIAIQAAVQGITYLIQREENLCQATRSSAQEAKSASQSINDYAEKYKALHDELTNANTTEERQAEIKKELLSIQTDLNDKYGDEYGRINLVTDAYKDQTDAIKNLDKAKAEHWLADNNKGIEQATHEMEKKRPYVLGSSVSLYSESGQAVMDITKKYEDRGIKADLDETSGTYSITLKANAEDAEKTINDFKMEIYELKEKFKDDSLVNDVLNTSNDASDSVGKLLDKFQTTYNQAKISTIKITDELSKGYDNAEHAVEAYNDALASGDEDKIKEARAELENTRNSIDLTSEKWKSYTNIINDVFNQADTRIVDFKASLESQDGKNLVNDIKGYTETELKAMANDGSNNDAMDKLMESAKGYELSVEDVISVLKEMGIIIDETANKSSELPKSFSKQEMISAINSLSGGFESLDKIMSSIKSDNPFDYSLLDDNTFKETFSGLGEEYNNFIAKISDSPKDINACQDAFNDLVTAWINSKDILNNLSEDTADLTVDMLSNMGVVNAQEVVVAALAQKHAEAAWSARDLSNATTEEIEALANESEATDGARNAFELYIAQKMLQTAIDTGGDITALANVVNALGIATSAWQKYYAAKDKMEQMNSNKKEFINGQTYYTYQTEENGRKITHIASQAAYDQIQREMENSSKQYAQDLENMAKDIKVSYGGGAKSNKSGSGGSKGSSAPKENSDIDWIDRRIKLIQQKNTELKDALSDTYTAYTGLSQNEIARANELFNQNLSPASKEVDELITLANKAGMSIKDLQSAIQNGSGLESRQSILEQLISNDKVLIGEYQNSVEQYKQSYEDLVAKVPNYRDKIENGGVDIELVSGDLKTQIQNAVNAYDKWQESLKNIDNQTKELRNHNSQYYDNISDSIDAANSKLDASNKLIEKQIDTLSAQGHVVSSSMYESLSNNTLQQIHNAEKLLKTKKSKLSSAMESGLTKNDEEYYKLTKDISDAESAILDLEKAQAEYNKKLLEMPVDNLDTVISMYSSIASIIQDWGSEVEASGKKLDASYYQSLIANGTAAIDQLKEQSGLIEDIMGEYDVGSEPWLNMYDKLKSCNSEMSNMVQNLQKWNEELLQIPIDNISKLSDELNKVLTGLNERQSEYDTVISSVTGAIKEQIDLLEKNNALTNESYNDKIKLLQEQLDLLEKTNTERNLQYNLEKAQYDLERARNQKSVAEIRNGEKVYAEDANAVREAQKNLQDAEFDIAKNNLQNQIDSLKDELDNINEKYSDQTELLNKQSDKWSEIADKIKQAQSELTATEILGSGWKDQVFSGQDNDIYSMFQGLYQTNADQILKYQEQVNATEKIETLLQDYITSYKEGTITYEQAQAGIKDLLSQINQKMSSTDNLQNIYDYLGAVNGTAANSEAVLGGIRSALDQSADTLIKSLEQYNENSGLISEYTSSWQQLTDNVENIKDILEEVKDALENASDRDDRDSERSSGGHWDSSDSSHGPGVPSYSDGISNGVVGVNPTETTDKIKVLALKALDNDEIPALLHRGEVVLNKKQQEILLRNFENSTYNPIANSARNLNFPQNSLNNIPKGDVTIKIGDIKLTDVRDVDGFAKAMGSQFNSLLMQEMKK